MDYGLWLGRHLLRFVFSIPNNGVLSAHLDWYSGRRKKEVLRRFLTLATWVVITIRN